MKFKRLYKKSATFEAYSWFLLVIAVGLLTVALAAFIIRISSINLDTFGERAYGIESALADKHIKYQIMDHLVKSAADSAAIRLSSTGGFKLAPGGEEFLGVPVLLINQLKVDNFGPDDPNQVGPTGYSGPTGFYHSDLSFDVRYFKQVFLEELNDKISFSNEMTKAQIEELKKDDNKIKTTLYYGNDDRKKFERRAVQRLNNTIINAHFSEDSISVGPAGKANDNSGENSETSNGAIYGYSTRMEHLFFNAISESKDANLGSGEMHYYLNFGYRFQMYNLDDYNAIYDFLINDVYAAIGTSICDPHDSDNTLLNELDTLSSYYQVGFNEYCLDFPSGSFAEYQFDSRVGPALRELRTSQAIPYAPDRCYIYICIKDKSRLLSGHRKDGTFIVDHPIYAFVLAEDIEY